LKTFLIDDLNDGNRIKKMANILGDNKKETI